MAKQCSNHPDLKALSSCRNCGRYFCTACLTEGKDYYYCGQERCQLEMRNRNDDLVTFEAPTSIPVNLVTIAVYSHPYEADLAKARVEAEGIPAFVADEFMVNLNWLYSNAIGGIRLQVPESDVELAREVLFTNSEDLPDISPNEEPDSICPKCGSTANEYVDPDAKRLTYLFWLIVTFPIFRTPRKLKCSKCNFIWKMKKEKSIQTS